MPIVKPTGLLRSAELVALLVLPVLFGGTAHAAKGAATTQAAKTIYCCEVNGRRECSDVLPQVCYGQAYREIGPQGTVRRSIEAPPTAAERARRKEEEAGAKDAALQAEKARRRDQALLDTYGSVEEIDRRRDRELADLDRGMDEVTVRIESLLDRRRRVLPDGADKRQVTRPQAEALHEIDTELASVRDVLDTKRREREAVRVRYEEDRERYLELSVKPRQATR